GAAHLRQRALRARAGLLPARRARVLQRAGGPAPAHDRLGGAAAGQAPHHADAAAQAGWPRPARRRVPRPRGGGPGLRRRSRRRGPAPRVAVAAREPLTRRPLQLAVVGGEDGAGRPPERGGLVLLAVLDRRDDAPDVLVAVHPAVGFVQELAGRP